VLGDALAGAFGDGEETELLLEAEAPLEIVQQGPGEVARQGHAVRDGAVGGLQMVAQVGDASGIGDPSVLGRRVGEGGAVLGDVDRLRRVVAVDPRQACAQPRGIDLPAHLGEVFRGRGRHRPAFAVGGGLHHRAAVVVQTQEIQGRGDGLEIADPLEGQVRAREMPRRDPVGHRVGGVGALEQGVQVPAVEEAVEPAGGVPVARAVGRRIGRAVVVDDAYLGGRRLGAQGPRGPAVGQQQVVGDPQGLGGIEVAGGVVALLVAQGGDAPGLVVGDPVADAVAQPAGDVPGVVDEGLGGGAVAPAAAVLQGLGEVPVVEGREGPDPGLEQAVDQGVVEVEAGRVGGARALGLDPRPGDGEAVGVQTEPLHQLDVVPPPVVVVAGDVGVRAVLDLARGRGEAVPDRLSAATRMAGALDLLGGGGGAPDEFFGKAHSGHVVTAPGIVGSDFAGRIIRLQHQKISLFGLRT